MKLVPLAMSCSTVLVVISANSVPIYRLLNATDTTRASLEVPAPPSRDPWYDPPGSWEAARPGAVLRIRQAPYIQAIVGFGYATAAWHILFRTTDSLSRPAWAVTTLFAPRTRSAENREGSLALLSYQLPYDSVNIDSSPSYTLYAGEPYGEIATTLEMGWFVNVPDYEGPLASYTSGLMAGHATLDSILASLGAMKDLLQKDPGNNTRVAMWGYSGGALASEWGAELAARYAPGLKIAGVALGGLTPNITIVGSRLNKGDKAGLCLSGIIGITSQHPDARRWIKSRLKESGPYNATGFFKVPSLSTSQCIEEYKYHDIYDYFKGGKDDFYKDKMIEMFNQDGVMGYHGNPRIPMFIHKAVNDQLSDISETDSLVDQFCKNGGNVVYHRNMAGDHDAEITNGRPAVLGFLTSVLEGRNSGLRETSNGCIMKNVTIDLVPGWLSNH